MSEKRLQKYVLDNIDHTGHWLFVESKEVSAGIPDLDFCIKGVEGKIELKHGTDKKPPTLRPTQCAWFRRRAGEGGNCWLLISWASQGNVDFYLIPGVFVPDLVKAKSKSEWIKNNIAVWNDRIDWTEFVKIITHPPRPGFPR